MNGARLVRSCILAGVFLTIHEGAPRVDAADPRVAPSQQPVKLLTQIAGVTLNPSSLTGGTSPVIGTVTLNQAAPAGGILVTFQNSNPAIAAVPPSVVVQPGATSATFVIQTSPVAQNPNVVTNPPSADISAQVGNAAPKVAKLTVLPATLTSLTLNPTSVRGGSAVAGQVVISGPAPAPGFTVALSSSAAAPSQRGPAAAGIVRPLTSPATVPQHVTIAPSATSAAFQIATRPVSESTPVQITGAYGAFNTKTAALTILPVGVASLSFTSAVGGGTSTGSVLLTSAAPPEGADVKLTVARASSNSPNPCTPTPTAPGMVHVKNGESSTTFPLTTFPAGINPNWFVVTAAFGSSAVTGNYHVGQAQVASLTLPTSVKGGTTVQLVINLTGPMGQCPSNVASPLGTVTITNSNPVVAQAPSWVKVPGGGTSTTVTITTSAVAQTTALTIGAYHLWESDKKIANLTLTP